MNCIKLLTVLCLILGSHSMAKAQLKISDFELGGSATKLDEQCIRIVPDVPYDSGSAWYKKPIDLNAPFQMDICIVLGCKDDEGADGIVFVFSPIAQTGYRGEGMGFAGLYPSLGIEFDTYQNYHLADPSEDHLAIMAHGRTHHGATLVGPVKLGNLENCERHALRILWKSEQKNLEIVLDGELIATYEEDLVQQIFQGNSGVYWGVTSATGRLSNNHDICIKKLVFAEANTLPVLDGFEPTQLMAQDTSRVDRME